MRFSKVVKESEHPVKVKTEAEGLLVMYTMEIEDYILPFGLIFIIVFMCCCMVARDD